MPLKLNYTGQAEYVEDGTERESDSCFMSVRCHRFMAQKGGGGVHVARDGSSAAGSADSCLVGVG